MIADEVMISLVFSFAIIVVAMFIIWDLMKVRRRIEKQNEELDVLHKKAKAKLYK